MDAMTTVASRRGFLEQAEEAFGVRRMKQLSGGSQKESNPPPSQT